MTCNDYIRRVIGVTRTFHWSITTGGAATALAGRDLRLVIVSAKGGEQVMEFTTDANVVTFTWQGTDQHRIDKYSVVLWENYGKPNQRRVDIHNFVELVPWSSEQSGEYTDLIEETIELNTSDFTDSCHGIPEGGLSGQVLKKKSDKDYDAEWGNESGGGTGLPDNYYVDEKGIYRMAPDNGEVYPVIHPDLSTNPSLLPQRLGLLDIYEVMIPLNRDDITAVDSGLIYIPYEYIPQGTKIIYANAFNLNGGCASCSMIDDSTQWILSMYSATAIINYHGGAQYGIRDTSYVLIRYLVEGREDYYYSPQPEPTPEPTPDEFKIVSVNGVHEGEFYGNATKPNRPSILFSRVVPQLTGVRVILYTERESFTPIIYAISGENITLSIEGWHPWLSPNLRRVDVIFDYLIDGKNTFTITFATS